MCRPNGEAAGVEPKTEEVMLNLKPESGLAGTVLIGGVTVCGAGADKTAAGAATVTCYIPDPGHTTNVNRSLEATRERQKWTETGADWGSARSSRSPNKSITRSCSCNTHSFACSSVRPHSRLCAAMLRVTRKCLVMWRNLAHLFLLGGETSLLLRQLVLSDALGLFGGKLVFHLAGPEQSQRRPMVQTAHWNTAAS